MFRLLVKNFSYDLLQTILIKTGWFNESTSETLEVLNSSYTGLSENEVDVRQQQYGKNELQENSGKSPLQLFLHQLKNPLIYILVGWLSVRLRSPSRRSQMSRLARLRK